MADLQLIQLESTDVTKWDFDSIKNQIAEKLSEYKNLVYTEDSIKTAKNDRTDLNKAKKVIEDARKAYKKKCLEPYEALEPKLSELSEMIENQRQIIDDTVKEFENKQKEEKEKLIKKFYKKHSLGLGDYAEKMYNSIFDPKWLNASTTKAKYEAAIITAIENAESDIEELREMKSPFFDTLVEKYIATLSVDEAKEKHDELVDAALKAGFTKKNLSKYKVPDEDEVDDEDSDSDEHSILVYADKNQLEKITAFLEEIGVEYELD